MSRDYVQNECIGSCVLYFDCMWVKILREQSHLWHECIATHSFSFLVVVCIIIDVMYDFIYTLSYPSRHHLQPFYSFIDSDRAITCADALSHPDTPVPALEATWRDWLWWSVVWGGCDMPKCKGENASEESHFDFHACRLDMLQTSDMGQEILMILDLAMERKASKDKCTMVRYVSKLR